MHHIEITIGRPRGPFFQYNFSEFLNEVRHKDGKRKARARGWISFVTDCWNRRQAGFGNNHQIILLLGYLHAQGACEEFTLEREESVAKEATAASSSWGRSTASSSASAVKTGPGWANVVRLDKKKDVKKEEESSEEKESEEEEDLTLELATLARSLAELTIKLRNKKK